MRLVVESADLTEPRDFTATRPVDGVTTSIPAPAEVAGFPVRDPAVLAERRGVPVGLRER